MIAFSRRSRRLTVIVPLLAEVRANGRPVRGRLVNLSAHGAFVEMPANVWDKETVLLTLDLPGLPGPGLELSAVTIWSNRSSLPAAPGSPEGCGLEFVRDRRVMMNALEAIRILRASGSLVEERDPPGPEPSPEEGASES